ncbi:hypothetical protein KKE06_00915, partial [Candidatus Micrarchaeota archaeon]|nr:hypothetical protein [Candidatus Micrarchaeota archaeon]
MKKAFFVLLVAAGLLFSGCVENTQDPYSAEFADYREENFSFEYPKWELHEPSPEKLVSVASAGAIIEVAPIEGNQEELFDAMVSSIGSDSSVEMLSIEKEKNYFSFKGRHEENEYRNSVKLVRCNEWVYSLNAICVEQVCENVQGIFEQFFDSIECLGYAEPEKELIEFKESDFLFVHPNWIELPDKKENEIKKIVFGKCLILLSSIDSDPVSLFDSTKNFLEKEPEAILQDSSSEEFSLQFKAPIDSIEYNIKTRFLYCNNKSYQLTGLCAKGTEQEKIDFAFSPLDSMECAREYFFEEPQPIDEYEIVSFSQEDYSIEYPDWEPAGSYSIQTVLGVNRGACSVVVNKYETNKETLKEYLLKSIEENDFELIEEKKDSLVFSQEYEENTIINSNKMVYCNYNTYVASFVCEETINEELGELKEEILESAVCAKEYIPSEVYIPQEQETPETPEPQEDPIVKTRIGERFGLNLRAIVDFINANE